MDTDPSWELPVGIPPMLACPELFLNSGDYLICLPDQ